ncbi:MAG: hypothetical protein WCC70_11860 [Candidatus Aquilonibacter sp.]
MNAKRLAAVTLLLFLVPVAGNPRGFGGGGGFSRGGGGGFSRGGGGFDMHNDAPASRPQSFSHSSTGPAGTSRTTTATSGSNGYARTTTATNGNATRTSYGAASSNGNYTHGSSSSNGYASQSRNTSGNTNTGNYSHTGSGSSPNGAYQTSGSGNTYNHTYSGSATGVNSYGQVYHSSTYANNGTVYHGAAVVNPVYGGYPVYGWNGGYAWYAAPYYYGGGFWGPFAIGVTSAAVYGSIVAANNQTITSYQVQPDSPGAKLLQSYHLTQTACGPPGLVVIYGPNNSAICADPNNLVSAGNYSVNSQTLTIVSEKPAP